MSINWRWNEKIGEAVVQQMVGDETKEFIKTIYEGNAFMIFLNEWNEDGVDKYSLYIFFADETHAKTCLGLNKKSDCGNLLDDGLNKLVKLRINKKKSRYYKKIVSLFAQAFDDIEIEIFSEENKYD